MLFFLYKFFYKFFILPLMLLNPKTAAGKDERLGNYNFKNETKTIWLHCVSVGEIMALSPFMVGLKGYSLVLSTSTPQGYNFATTKLKDVCKQIIYFPYDLKTAVQSAISAINPKLVLIMETEIWPVFIDELKKAKIPTAIINARISERTFKSYRALRPFFAPLLNKLDAILAQSDEDAQRFVKIGAKPDVVTVMGNIKFDIQKPAPPTFDFDLGKNPLFIAGSTHKGEDKIVLDAYLAAFQKHQNLKFLIAPRHPERVEEIKSLIAACNLPFALRSKNETFKNAPVMILDTTGELATAYSLATVAFLGGSFNKTGGHNPLEASIWSKPVLTGPNIRNFRYIFATLFAYGCAKRVKTPAELAKALLKLLDDKNYYDKMTIETESVFKENSGAVANLTEYMERVCK